MRSWPAASAVTDLSNADLITFGALLREQRSFRVDQLAELAGDGGAGSAGTSGSEVSGALEHAARHALAEIELALDRLRCGRYGRCVDCGHAVGRDRLEVLPAAARCMPCQHRVGHGRPPPRRHVAPARSVGHAR